jgi:serine/threonine protein kinase
MKSSVNAATAKDCPTCARPLPSGAPAGLCPACLLAQGAETESGAGGPRNRFVPPPLAEIAALFPQLEILRLLGAGGMGAVYQARQPALDRFVALKVLPAEADGGANFEERFNREARALARLSHPNIVAVHEFGQAGRLHYFLMEFVDGANLRQLEQASRLSPREALQLIPQICDALQYAHDEGVVHRDIKPENVLVDRKGRVKIADFGLAKILGHDPEAARLTVEGQVMGTPHYMAPEQVERPLAVDHRADIYSLGVVFYEMLTGDLPLGKFAPPSRKVQVDVRLDEIVLRALENDPARRYQQASEVKSGVATVVETPAPTGPGEEALPSLDSSQREKPAPGSSRLGKSWWRAITPGLAGFVVWLLVMVTTTAVTVTLPQTFEATARVSVDLPRDSGVIGSDPELIRVSAMQRICSLPVLEQTVDKLKLTERWAGKFGGGPLSTREAASWLAPMISVRSIRLTRLFEIECSNGSPIEAAEFANAVAESFVDQSRIQPPPIGGPTAGRFDATLVDRAVVPLRASKPNMPLNFVLGFVGGGAAGGLAALFVGWRQRRAGGSGPVEDKRRSRFVVGAAVAVVIGVPFAVVLKAARTAQQPEPQRAKVPLMQVVRPGGSPLGSGARPSAAPPAAALELRPVVPADDTTTPFELLTTVAGQPLRVAKTPLLRGDAFAGASWRMDPVSNTRVIVLHLSDPGRRAFARLSAEHVREQVALVLAGRVLFAPQIAAPMDVATLDLGGLDRERGQFVELLAALNPRPAAAGPIRFGAEHEAVLLNSGGRKFHWWNLAEARAMTVAGTDRSTREYHEVRRGAGGDLEALGENPVPVVSGHDLTVVPLAGDGQSPTALEVAYRWELLHQEPEPENLLSTGTYALRTRRGFTGILEVLGWTQDQTGVRIRYREVVNSNAPPDLGSPPRLRILAWQAGTAPAGAAGTWRPDGTPVPLEDLAVMRRLSVGLVGLGRPESSGKEHYLHVCLSHPAFDRHSFLGLDLLDENSRATSSLGGDRATSFTKAERAQDADAWWAITFNPGAGDQVRKAVNLRLRYAVGPLVQVQSVPAQSWESAALNGWLLSGVGEEDRRRTYLALSGDDGQDQTSGVQAVLKDGRTVDAESVRISSSPSVRRRRFIFAAPLAEVLEFRVGRRAIRTVDWTNVVLLPGKPRALPMPREQGR